MGNSSVDSDQEFDRQIDEAVRRAVLGDQEPETAAIPNAKRARSGDNSRQRKASSDRGFWVVTVLILLGIGTLVLYFLAELPLWQAALLSPLGIVALVVLVLTWSWRSRSQLRK